MVWVGRDLEGPPVPPPARLFLQGSSLLLVFTILVFFSFFFLSREGSAQWERSGNDSVPALSRFTRLFPQRRRRVSRRPGPGCIIAALPNLSPSTETASKGNKTRINTAAPAPGPRGCFSSRPCFHLPSVTSVGSVGHLPSPQPGSAERARAWA